MAVWYNKNILSTKSQLQHCIRTSREFKALNCRNVLQILGTVHRKKPEQLVGAKYLQYSIF